MGKITVYVVTDFFGQARTVEFEAPVRISDVKDYIEEEKRGPIDWSQKGILVNKVPHEDNQMVEDGDQVRVYTLSVKAGQ